MEGQRQVDDDARFVTLLDTILHIAPGERRAFLEAACSAEPALRASLLEHVEWEERMGDFLLTPILRRPLSDRVFQPGDHVAGRFRIVREVGRGGMGIIYEAIDERLGQRRALKCARHGFQERLPPEARAAMRVTHDNICRVYEIHTADTSQGSIDVLSMEFVEGETLSTRIRRDGALPPLITISIFRQLCLGLSAAHKQGLLHRDLKASNVMVTRDQRAVIMDFGLARDVAPVADFQFSTELRGAPAYIAPELWSGSAASVVSDIYALGCIGYEMITGGQLFPPGTSMERRLTQRPAAPAFQRRGLDPVWDRVLLRCLEPEPSRRFQSVAELSGALAPREARRVWIPVTVLIMMAALAIFVLRPPGSRAPAVRLAILPLEASACENTPIGGVLYDISERLQRLRGVTAIPLSQTVRRRVLSPADAVSKLGATHVVRVSARCTPGAFAVDGKVVDANSSIALRSFSGTYTNSTLSAMSNALIGAVTASFKLRTRRPMDSVNADAFPSYAEGIEWIRSDRASSDRAIPLFEQAAGLDRESALPLTGLTEAYLSKFRATKDRQWLGKARQALLAAESRNPDSAAVHFEAGGVNRAAGSYDQAAESYRRALQLEPWNGDAWNHLAITYGEMQGRHADAAQAFAKAIELQPGYFEPHVDLAIFYFRLGNYPLAEEQFKMSIKLAPGNASFHSDLCGVYTSMTRYAEAEKACRQALELSPTAPAHNNLGAILAYEGRDGEALKEYRKAIELEPKQYVFFQNSGDSLRRLRLSSDASKDYRVGRELTTALLREDPANAALRSFSGYFAIRMKNVEAGREEIEQALRLAPDNVPVLRNAVLALEAIHQRDRVIALLRGGPSALVRELERHPDLQQLREDSRFAQLIPK